MTSVTRPCFDAGTGIRRSCAALFFTLRLSSCLLWGCGTAAFLLVLFCRWCGTWLVVEPHELLALPLSKCPALLPKHNMARCYMLKNVITPDVLAWVTPSDTSCNMQHATTPAGYARVTMLQQVLNQLVLLLVL